MRIHYGTGYRIYFRQKGDILILLMCGDDKSSQSKDIKLAKAIGVIARAKGMRQIAEETGLSREQLYRSFSEGGNPTLKSTLTVIQVLGINLTVKLP